ncbi:type I-E CRISPR-associated protein Cse2/CasB [Oenococcus sicerae]|uniref:Type I-E CRISPR-associated protein Cse2/CasB n=1 Tax=Oenococcus sicerae TaxID=2203724 RepID=A0ABX5QP10_9LACO|nr:type I-E CRISPR-associated protein Cse2/CasB [Oenococcus sicerae]QAS70545.1 type I-E CRISPR-associated protein Cse2/CasB [Oenococcus sicerae]
MAYQIKNTTIRIIQELYNNENSNKAVLASLRGAANLTSLRAVLVWPILLANMDSEYLSKDGSPTHAEIAVFVSARLFAIHQQGKTHLVYGNASSKPVPEGLPVFTALSEMRNHQLANVALDRRVGQLLATTNLASVINSLTHLISIIKARNGDARIDYAALAEDLYWFQANFEQANQVRLRWGQAYYHSTIQQSERTEKND